ncbi:hypothetical protein ACFX2F_003353 [Malus domestica]
MKNISSGKMLFKGPVQHGFYQFQTLNSALVNASHLAFAASANASRDFLNQRLGHPSPKIINKLTSESCISVSGNNHPTFCNGCALSKSSKLPFVSVLSRTSKPLELLHTDVWGPTSVSSVHHHKYYVIFVDDFTKYCWFFPLQYKSDVFSTFVKFKAHVENMLCSKIQTLRSDSGGEYLSSQFSQFLVDHIHHQLSCPHTQEQNGCSERKHRHIVETARTLLIVSHVPHIYWDHAFATAVYLINRMPTTSKASPWELLFNRSPSYHTLKIFGCSCFPWLQPYSHQSWILKANTAFFWVTVSITRGSNVLILLLKGSMCPDMSSSMSPVFPFTCQSLHLHPHHPMLLILFLFHLT